MSEPKKRSDPVFDSNDVIVVEFDGPGDTTRGPWPPNLPRDWDGRPPPKKPAPQDPPPETTES